MSAKRSSPSPLAAAACAGGRSLSSRRASTRTSPSIRKQDKRYTYSGRSRPPEPRWSGGRRGGQGARHGACQRESTPVSEMTSLRAGTFAFAEARRNATVLEGGRGEMDRTVEPCAARF